MARKSLKSIGDSTSISLKESIEAIRYIPRFFTEIRLEAPSMFFLNVGLRLISSLTPIIILWVGKLIIDEIIQLAGNGGDQSQLWTYVGIEFGVVIIADILGRLVTLTDGLLGDLYSNASSVKIIRKTSSLSISQLEDPEFYDKLERARTQTNNRVNLLSTSMTQIQSLIVVGSLIVGLVYFEPWLIALLVVSIIPSFINEFKYSSQQYSLARSWTKERRELDYVRFIGANDKTAKEIKLFGLTRFLAERFKSLSDQYYEINKKLAIRRSALGTLFNILGVVAYYGAYILIIYRALNGLITVGELTFLSGSFNRLKNTMQGIFSKFTRIAQSALFLKDYFDFIDLRTTQENANSNPKPLPSSITEGFRFDNVHFHYPGNETKVLKGINFTINAHEKIAFVGENGAGKTTLIKLLLRFYEPTEGAIYLDGINIKEYDIQAYQKRFGVIFQDFVRYEFTAKDNIAVGNIDERDDLARIQQAAENSLASDVVKTLSRGYDQQLGKRFANGKDLSGGQWQKIALARAYMKNADILILDEPTSALDARAEYEAFQRFIALTKGKTSIIISHRFSTVRMADRIVVLHDGKILENGTHDELMSNNELYAELFNLQAAGYM